MFRTARWRLVTWNVVVLSLILLLIGVAVYVYFYENLYKEVDQQLVIQQARVESDFGGTSVINPQSLDFTLNQDPTWASYIIDIANINLGMEYPLPVGPGCGVQLAPTKAPCVYPKPLSLEAMQRVRNELRSRDGLPPLQQYSDIRTVSPQGVPYRVRTFVMQTEFAYVIVQVGRNIQAERTKLEDLRTILLYGSLMGVLLAAIGSLFLANRALVPIRRAFDRQRTFTADASHELRTPLALIRANAEMLERHAGSLADDDAEMITEIIRETDHLNRLVGDLLTLARSDAGSVKLEQKPVDLRALVSQVHEDIRLIAESRGITAELSLDGPVRIQGDEGRLRQLLLILLDNAFKYTPDGGAVSTSLANADGRARLVVQDTGIGIPHGDLPHIFDRFYRVDQARSHEGSGTGLGLAIARWIVQAHHGSIKVDSEVNGGTRFQIDLPAMSREGGGHRPQLPVRDTRLKSGQ